VFHTLVMSVGVWLIRLSLKPPASVPKRAHSALHSVSYLWVLGLVLNITKMLIPVIASAMPFESAFDAIRTVSAHLPKVLLLGAIYSCIIAALAALAMRLTVEPRDLEEAQGERLRRWRRLILASGLATTLIVLGALTGRLWWTIPERLMLWAALPLMFVFSGPVPLVFFLANIIKGRPRSGLPESCTWVPYGLILGGVIGEGLMYPIDFFRLHGRIYWGPLHESTSIALVLGGMTPFYLLLASLIFPALGRRLSVVLGWIEKYGNLWVAAVFFAFGSGLTEMTRLLDMFRFSLPAWAIGFILISTPKWSEKTRLVFRYAVWAVVVVAVVYDYRMMSNSIRYPVPVDTFPYPFRD